MALFRRPRLFAPTASGTFDVRLAPESREWVVRLADQLDILLSDDTPDLKRLFPTAYPDDPERDAGYQVLAREQLIDERRASIEVMRRSAASDQLTGEELTAWMRIVNDIRLVLGTRLDVSEDDDDRIDPDDPTFDAQVIYRELGFLLSEIVDALTSTLPPPTDR